eukprot:3643587-Prymnesium_polylepis.1
MLYEPFTLLRGTALPVRSPETRRKRDEARENEKPPTIQSRHTRMEAPEQLLGPLGACLPSPAKPMAPYPKAKYPRAQYLARKQCVSRWLADLNDRLSSGEATEDVLSSDEATSDELANSERCSMRLSVADTELMDDADVQPMKLLCNVRRSIDLSEPSGTFEVVVPEDCRAGDIRMAIIGGDRVKVTVPESAQPGDVLTFVHMPSSGRGRQRSSHRGSHPGRQSIDAAENSNDLMEVDVPEGRQAGDALKVMTPSGLCHITVPDGAEAGTTLMFHLPPRAGRRASRGTKRGLGDRMSAVSRRW